MDLLFSVALGLSLSMDAFAVSCAMGVCGLSDIRGALKLSLSFGVFQALMPLLGWLGASSFGRYLERVDHWVALGALSLVGGKMILEGLEKLKGETCPASADLGTGRLLTLSIGTSIDALAVGVGFIGMRLNVPVTSLVIGVVTFLVCLLGVLGSGRLFKPRGGAFEMAGGTVLIIIGVKILLEHLGS
ncbi:MAG: manganese efflux pump MntP family protein [Thermanaerothrix sp.]|nr:manganese efflux pump MntP family protein [Thermanaerothrix sp.]